MEYVIAHDVGTSGLKSALVDAQGDLLTIRTSHYPSRVPQPVWFEQDPNDYWRATVINTCALLEEYPAARDHVIGLAFSAQAMGIIAVGDDGEVLYPNIAWVDGRAGEEAEIIMRRFGGRHIFRSIAGIELSGKDVIPKLRWIRKHLPRLQQKARHILDVNGYLKFRATGRAVFEWSGACSYGFNLRRKDWERLFFRAAGIDLALFPPLVRSTDRVGGLTVAAADELGLPAGVPVYGGCDDTQSAALGSGCACEGDAHIYLGSSAWAGLTTARNLRHSHGAVCLQSADPAMNLVVGVTESAGTHLKWFLDRFYPMEQAGTFRSDLQELIDHEFMLVPPGSDHLIFTPWLMGERCPFTSTTTRSTIFNIGPEHGRGHFLRALLEGIGYNLRWILERFSEDYGITVATLRATGGGALNDHWLQAIADITGCNVSGVPQPSFSGTLGAAACVLVGSGRIGNFGEFARGIPLGRTFRPNLTLQTMFDERFAAYQGIHRSLQRTYRSANLQRFHRSS